MKELCIVLVVILATSLVGMAQAETYITPIRTDYFVDTAHGDGDEVHYYASVTSDHIDDVRVIEVDQQLYEMLLAEQEAENEHYNGLWYVQACRWTSQAATDAWDWISFWD